MNMLAESSDDGANLLAHQVAATDAELRMVVGDAVTDAGRCDDLPNTKASSTKRRSERFRERLDAWTKLHPVLDHEIDDSRESIYEGCGE